MSTLKLSDFGIEVIKVQLLLNYTLRPCPFLVPTGFFDNRTQAAVRAFQKEKWACRGRHGWPDAGLVFQRSHSSVGLARLAAAVTGVREWKITTFTLASTQSTKEMMAMRLKQVGHAIFAIALVAMLTACQDSVSADKNACPESAQHFWKAFRGAVLKNDLDAIADLTHFPFQLSIGSLDFDRKEVYLARQQFIAVFPKLLSSDPGYSDAPNTMKDYIRASSTIPMPSKTCTPATKEFGVGNWVFIFKPGGWRFARAFAGEEFAL